MAFTHEMQATCSLCGGQEKVLAYGSINTAEDPDLKAKVKDGSLFVWECPHCGTANLARYACLYHDPQERLMIWLLPDGPVPETASVAATLDSLDGLNQDGAVGSELFDGFELLDREQAQEIFRTGRDKHGNFFSLAAWMVLGIFLSRF